MTRGLCAFRYCRLAAKTKRPVDENWPDRTTDPNEAVAAGFGIGLILGPQPSGQYLIAIDVDSPAGAEWLSRNELPPCPTILSLRGPKYILSLPPGYRVSHLSLHDGVEVLGERHQVVLPSPHSPDDRRWERPLDDPVPQAPPWLLEAIKTPISPAPKAAESVRAEPPVSDIPRPRAKALETFITDVAPKATKTDSNRPLLCAAAIVAHRMDGLKDSDLVSAVLWANSQLPSLHRESPKQAIATAKSVQRHNTRFSPKVLSERTGIHLYVCKLMLSYIENFERTSTSIRSHIDPQEIQSRVLTTLCLTGQNKGGLIYWHGTVSDLARETGLSYATLKRRTWMRALGPLVAVISTARGRGGGVWLASPLRLLAKSVFFGLLKNALQERQERKGSFCLSRYIEGGIYKSLDFQSLGLYGEGSMYKSRDGP